MLCVYVSHNFLYYIFPLCKSPDVQVGKLCDSVSVEFRWYFTGCEHYLLHLKVCRSFPCPVNEYAEEDGCTQTSGYPSCFVGTFPDKMQKFEQQGYQTEYSFGNNQNQIGNHVISREVYSFRCEVVAVEHHAQKNEQNERRHPI